MIRSVNIEDSEAICNIYNYYVRNTIITFEEDPLSIEEMKERITEVISSFPWLVSEKDGMINGYAYADKWKTRCAYRFSVESTIYIHPDFTGKGIGRQLYETLISELRNRSIHSVIGGIALPNKSSVALHEKLGFLKVAHFKEVGWKFNRWIDVGYWELLLQNDNIYPPDTTQRR